MKKLLGVNQMCMGLVMKQLISLEENRESVAERIGMKIAEYQNALQEQYRRIFAQKADEKWRLNQEGCRSSW